MTQMAGYESGCDPQGLCREFVLCQRCNQCVGHCQCLWSAVIEEAIRRIQVEEP